MTRCAASFPRPPSIELADATICVILGDELIAQSAGAWRILETFHPPTYYLPIGSFRTGALVRGTRRSFCEWKGEAHYHHVQGGGRVEKDAAWAYDDPSPPYAALRAHVAIYPARMDACTVDGERVTPQPGGFYGGWITSAFEGPFKGERGTAWW